MVRDGEIRPPAPWPPQVGEQGKKSIALHVTEVGRRGGRSEGASAAIAGVIHAQAIKAYTESGLFSSVVTTGERTDLEAEITIIEAGEEGLSWPAALSAFTFTMIPGYIPQDLIVKTSYKDREKKVIGVIEKKEGLGFWVQFFLVFSMPFGDGPDTITDTAQYDMHKVTIVTARSNAYF